MYIEMSLMIINHFVVMNSYDTRYIIYQSQISDAYIIGHVIK